MRPCIHNRVWAADTHTTTLGLAESCGFLREHLCTLPHKVEVGTGSEKLYGRGCHTPVHRLGWQRGARSDRSTTAQAQPGSCCLTQENVPKRVCLYLTRRLSWQLLAPVHYPSPLLPLHACYADMGTLVGTCLGTSELRGAQIVSNGSALPLCSGERNALLFSSTEMSSLSLAWLLLASARQVGLQVHSGGVS